MFLWFKRKKYSLADTLKFGKDFLKNANLESYIIDAKILLNHITKIPQIELITNPKQTISSQFYKRYIKVIKQRANNKPIALITGQKEFYGLTFQVSKATLIPRPDSETLIDAVKKEFTNQQEKLNILDMGTGSGCLLLTLLNEYPNATGLGMDNSQSALKIANQNMNNLKLSSRTQFINHSWTTSSPHKLLKNQKFDIIISNPPYIRTDEMTNLSKDVKNFEPHTALTSGKTGLEDYKTIANQIKKWDIIKSNGNIFLEIGQKQENEVKTIFSSQGLTFKKEYKDLQSIIRILEFSN